MARKFWLIVGSALLLVALLTSTVVGCTTPAPTPAPTPTPTPAPTPAPAPAPAPVEVTWKCNIYCPQGLATVQIDRWGYLMNLATDGRFTLDMGYSGAFGPKAEVADHLKAGLYDVGMVCVPMFPGKFPLMDLLDRPGGSLGQYDAAYKVVQELRKFPPIMEEIAAYDIEFLIPVTLPEYDSICSTFPIKTLDDLDGSRFVAIEAVGQIYAELGASTTYIPPADMYEAFERGMIDAATYPAWDMPIHNYQDVCDYLLMNTGFSSAQGVFIGMNKASWEALPDDMKAISNMITDHVSNDLGMVVMLRMNKGTDDALVVLRAAGMEVSVLAEEERLRMVEIADELAAVWLEKLDAGTALEGKGPLPGTEVWNRIKELQQLYLKELGYID